MPIKFFIPFLLYLFSFPAGAHSTERENLAQAIKQLDAAQQSLMRAAEQARLSPKSREYFDYQGARQDIETVKSGIRQYISPSRAVPRDPKALRTLKEDYMKLRGQ